MLFIASNLSLLQRLDPIQMGHCGDQPDDQLLVILNKVIPGDNDDIAVHL